MFATKTAGKTNDRSVKADPHSLALRLDPSIVSVTPMFSLYVHRSSDPPLHDGCQCPPSVKSATFETSDTSVTDAEEKPN